MPLFYERRGFLHSSGRLSYHGIKSGFGFCQFEEKPLVNDQYYWLGVFLQDSISVSREDLALSMVETTLETSSVSASVQVMILREYKSIMQLRYTKPSVVHM